MKDDKTKKRARAALLTMVIKDRVELEGVVSKAAALQLSRDALVIKRDQKLAALKEEYNKEIGELNDELKASVNAMESWSIRNREEAFEGVQSITVLGHTLEFRVSPGKVECLKGHTAETVMEALMALPDDEFADLFIRYKTELDKEAVLKHWDAEGHILARLGLTVVKPEAFTFEPDREAIGNNRESGATRREVA